MFDPNLFDEATRLTETPFAPTPEEIDATPESVLEAADTDTDSDEAVLALGRDETRREALRNITHLGEESGYFD